MVKITVSVFVTAALASSALAHDAVSGASSAEDIAARGISESVPNSLFSRAAVKAVNNLFSREQLSSLLERDVADGEVLSARDLEDLLEREVDLDGRDEAGAGEGAGKGTEDAPAAGAGAEAVVPSSSPTAEEGKPPGTGPAPPSPASAPASGSAPSPTPASSDTVALFGQAVGIFGGILQGKWPGATTAAPTPSPSPSAAAKEAGSAHPPEEKDSKAEGADGGAAAAEGADEAPAARSLTTMLEEPIERSFGEDLELDQREWFGELEERDWLEGLQERDVLWDSEAELEAREFLEEEMEARDVFDELD